MSANNVDPDQMPHDVASDLGLHCLPYDTLKDFQGMNGLSSHAFALLLSSLILAG